MSHWYVYIISNNSHTLYVGATNNLPKRIRKHKNKVYTTAFTARYTFDRRVYFEHAGEQKAAIGRETADQAVVAQEEGRTHSAHESELAGSVPAVLS